MRSRSTGSRSASLRALQRQLRKADYHVFHYIGHGGYDHDADDGVLLFEDDQGRGRRVSGVQLGTILADEVSLRLAVLNSCEGGRSSLQDPFSGVATSLIEREIPAVIGMQFEITDRAAIVFAGEFYAALADGLAVDSSVAEARKAIYADENDIEWGTPVLFMRVADGRLFDVQAHASIRAPSSEPEAASPDEVRAAEEVEREAEAARREAAEAAERQRVEPPPRPRRNVPRRNVPRRNVPRRNAPRRTVPRRTVPRRSAPQRPSSPSAPPPRQRQDSPRTIARSAKPRQPPSANERRAAEAEEAAAAERIAAEQAEQERLQREAEATAEREQAERKRRQREADEAARPAAATAQPWVSEEELVAPPMLDSGEPSEQPTDQAAAASIASGSLIVASGASATAAADQPKATEPLWKVPPGLIRGAGRAAVGGVLTAVFGVAWRVLSLIGPKSLEDALRDVSDQVFGYVAVMAVAMVAAVTLAEYRWPSVRVPDGGAYQVVGDRRWAAAAIQGAVAGATVGFLVANAFNGFYYATLDVLVVSTVSGALGFAIAEALVERVARRRAGDSAPA